MFAPEDLYLVKGSPQVRRRFLDMEIGQISPVYLHDLLNISKKLLKQRNHILKQHQGKSILNDVMFDVYTEQYIDAAVKVIRKRFQFMELLTKMGRTDSFWYFQRVRKIESITIILLQWYTS